MKKDNNKVYSPTPYGFNRKGDDLVVNMKEKRLLNKMFRLKDNGSSDNYGFVSFMMSGSKVGVDVGEYKEITSSALPCSLILKASSNAISSNGFMLILTPSFSTPLPSERTLTRTL